MSEHGESDVYRRLQISPSKNNYIKKPALRLSPRRAYKVNDINYTPSRPDQERISKRLTQSLDRNARLFIPPMSPTNRLQTATKGRINSRGNAVEETESKTRTNKEIIQRGPTTNLLARLPEASFKRDEISERKEHPMNIAHNTSQRTKSVKFFLPTDENSKDELRQMRELLEHVVRRQDELERSISDIKYQLKKSNT